MRILFAGHSLATPLGGGELSARTLLGRLATAHDVEACCVGVEDRDYVMDGMACRDVSVDTPSSSWPMHLRTQAIEARFRPALARRLAGQPPDLLLLQQPACPDAADVPSGTRVVVFLRSLACYGVGDPTPVRWKRAAGRMFREVRWYRNRDLLRRADLVVTNSHFLQQSVLNGTGVRSEVVPPFIDTAGGGNDGPPGHALTFVGLDPWKGAHLALQLAEALPQRQFLFFEGARPRPDLVARARRLPNVTCEGWTTDMATMLARTRVLLMPSTWDEPFGRLPVEAGACGIPTIATARGGLRESVGEGGLLLAPTANLASWIDAIGSMDDPVRYAAWSAAARGHARTMDMHLTFARFVDIVRRTTGLELGEER